jgi:predicted neutral ceramidase superfamily lipid hydrolase
MRKRLQRQIVRAVIDADNRFQLPKKWRRATIETALRKFNRRRMRNGAEYPAIHPASPSGAHRIDLQPGYWKGGEK